MIVKNIKAPFKYTIEGIVPEELYNKTLKIIKSEYGGELEYERIINKTLGEYDNERRKQSFNSTVAKNRRINNRIHRMVERELSESQYGGKESRYNSRGSELYGETEGNQHSRISEKDSRNRKLTNEIIEHQLH